MTFWSKVAFKTIDSNEYIFDYLHHRRRKPLCSLEQIPRCTLIVTGVHRTFTSRSLNTCSSKTEREAACCSLSASFARCPLSGSTQKLRHTRIHRLFEDEDLFKVSFNVVSRSCPRFLATTSKSLLLARSFYSVDWRKSILLLSVPVGSSKRYYVSATLIQVKEKKIIKKKQRAFISLFRWSSLIVVVILKKDLAR